VDVNYTEAPTIHAAGVLDVLSDFWVVFAFAKHLGHSPDVSHFPTLTFWVVLREHKDLVSCVRLIG
jgi:hypothetical protein